MRQFCNCKRVNSWQVDNVYIDNLQLIFGKMFSDWNFVTPSIFSTNNIERQNTALLLPAAMLQFTAYRVCTRCLDRCLKHVKMCHM
jgi:hypothetical protein